MSDTPGSDNLSAVSRQYRTAAGLEERESDAPETDLVNDEDGPTVEERENAERTEDDRSVDVDTEDVSPEDVEERENAERTEDGVLEDEQ